jgi:hypothetical protein
LKKEELMEQDGLQVFFGVASANNGGNSLLGLQWDSLMLDLTFQNIINRYNYFIGDESVPAEEVVTFKIQQSDTVLNSFF